MPSKRKPKRQAKQKRKQEKKKNDAPKGYMSVPAAAEFLNMTEGGVHAAIKRRERGQEPSKWDLAAKRVGKRVFIARDEVRRFHKVRMDFYFPKPKTQKQLDDEFLQRMWDNDPD